jgi:hypothetical protein
MASRRQNEKAFGQWQDLPGGGRIYIRRIDGRSGGFARYCKETDASENTTRFWQEVYDQNGKLAARHEKFPFDSGHQSV